MVKRGLGLLMLGGALLQPAASRAQSLDDVAPAVQRDDPEYKNRPVEVGGFALSSGADLRIEYDDNIYALPDNAVGDEVGTVELYGGARREGSTISVNLEASARLRRYASKTSENSDAYRFAGDLAWKPSQADTLRLQLSSEREIEDRGDPEARDPTAPGPREIDVMSAIVGFRHAPGRVFLDLEAAARKFNARSAVDANRDFSSYSGRAAAGYRLSGSLFATVTGFINRRDFRLDRTLAGIERNATTYGGRLGVEIAPGGLFEGNLSAGVFRFDPDDPSIPERTGLSVAGQLIYRPTRRSALILGASNGDVATFRIGATGRTDTRVRLTWQQEVRHNLLASATVGYRKSKFIGTGNSEKTVIGRMKVEYVLSRNVSVMADVSYGKRTADLAPNEFERFRGGLGLRLRF